MFEQYGSNLALYYSQAIEQEYGIPARISKYNYDKFRQRDVELRVAGVDVKHYAFTVAKLLRGWCDQHQQLYIPANVFLGKFAFDKYMKHRQRASVELVDVGGKEVDINKAFFTEIQLCSVYFNALRQGKKVDEEQLVKDFLLSEAELVTEEWKTVVRAGNRQLVIAKVIDYYLEFGVGFHTKKHIPNYKKLFLAYLDNANTELSAKKKIRKSKIKFAELSDIEKKKLLAYIEQLDTDLANLERGLLRA